MNTNTTTRTRFRGEKGIAVIMTALCLLPLMAFAAFGVDLASLLLAGQLPPEVRRRRRPGRHRLDARPHQARPGRLRQPPQQRHRRRRLRHRPLQRHHRPRLHRHLPARHRHRPRRHPLLLPSLRRAATRPSPAPPKPNTTCRSPSAAPSTSSVATPPGPFPPRPRPSTPSSWPSDYTDSGSGQPQLQRRHVIRTGPRPLERKPSRPTTSGNFSSSGSQLRVDGHASPTHRGPRTCRRPTTRCVHRPTHRATCSRPTSHQRSLAVRPPTYDEQPRYTSGTGNRQCTWTEPPDTAIGAELPQRHQHPAGWSAREPSVPGRLRDQPRLVGTGLHGRV